MASALARRLSQQICEPGAASLWSLRVQERGRWLFGQGGALGVDTKPRCTRPLGGPAGEGEAVRPPGSLSLGLPPGQRHPSTRQPVSSSGQARLPPLLCCPGRTVHLAQSPRTPGLRGSLRRTELQSGAAAGAPLHTLPPPGRPRQRPAPPHPPGRSPGSPSCCSVPTSRGPPSPNQGSVSAVRAPASPCPRLLHTPPLGPSCLPRGKV